MDTTPAVVVGGGVAAVSAVAALRGAGFDGRILLIGEEPELPYRRPTVSKDLVRGDKTIDQVRIKPESWYVEQQVDLLTGHRAVGLDVPAARLTLEDGSEIGYGRLLLATGGRARAPWIGSRVVTLRTAADAAGLRDRLDGVEDVLVVGAGLVGSETAASLRALDLQVTLLETAPHPLPRLLTPDLAEHYTRLHKAHGTLLEVGVDVRAVTEHPDRVTVTAADARQWSAALVVVAVGMEPETALALDGGLQVAGGGSGGIVVDAAGRTSAPDVFAAGDVAWRPTSYAPGLLRTEHWQSAQNHGTAVGRAMAGEDVSFDEVPWCWSDQYGVNLQITGWPDLADDLVLRGDPEEGAFTAFFVRDSVLRGAVAIGRPADVRAARALVGQRARVSPALLADSQTPVGETVLP